MSKIGLNKEAWEMLRVDEQAAISLSLGHGKSTWQAGEILNKAHFKYLEIQKRGRKFLEMFTNHIEKYNGLFPAELYMSFAFKEYLGFTIMDRLNISTAVSKMEDPSYNTAKKRNKAIIHEIKRLQNDNSDQAMDMYSLIMDFDRWNNFRILPINIQEPSAFKRRNKARNLKHLNTILSIPQFSILHIIDTYTYRGSKPKLFLPLISGHLGITYKIMPIRNHPPIVNELNNIGLFLFATSNQAQEFAKLVSDYFLSEAKTCKSGQKFWPKFRECFEKSLNFKELSNIHKSRSYLDHVIFEKSPRKKSLPKTTDKNFYK